MHFIVHMQMKCASVKKSLRFESKTFPCKRSLSTGAVCVCVSLSMCVSCIQFIYQQIRIQLYSIHSSTNLQANQRCHARTSFTEQLCYYRVCCCQGKYLQLFQLVSTHKNIPPLTQTHCPPCTHSHGPYCISANSLCEGLQNGSSPT